MRYIRLYEGFENLNTHSVKSFCEKNIKIKGFDIEVRDRYIAITSETYDSLFKLVDVKDKLDKFLNDFTEHFEIKNIKNPKHIHFAKYVYITIYQVGTKKEFTIRDFIDNEVRKTKSFIEEIRINWPKSWGQ